MPSSARTFATAPINASVFLRGRENRSFASFQSGRMELKILLCFTWPAITALLTPSLCISSMALLSSPRPTQCSLRAAFSRSGEASSRKAITAISIPWLRAPSRTRNGNRPLPAISPQPESSIVFSKGGTMCIGPIYFVSPRSAVSMKRISSSTSAEPLSVARMRSIACVVFNFERSRRR